MNLHPNPGTSCADGWVTRALQQGFYTELEDYRQLKISFQV